MNENKIRVGIIHTNREPYPLPNGVTNGGLVIAGILAENIPSDTFAVTFFTPTDSTTGAPKESFESESFFSFSEKKILHEEYSALDHKVAQQMEQSFFLKAVEYANTHLDILHVHNYFWNVASLFDLIKIPVVYTFHDPTTPYHHLFLDKLTNTTVIMLSKNHLELAHKNKVKTDTFIYNGIDEHTFSFNAEAEEDLLYVGRMVENKGVLVALEAAKRLSKPLSLVGQFDMVVNDPHVVNTIKDALASKPAIFSHYSTYGKTEIVGKYQRSKVTLCPANGREEPFGLAPIESLSCGTPVIAFANGALPEIVEDGVTGFIVNPSEQDIRGDFTIKKTGIEGLCEAVERVYALPQDEYKQMRAASRQRVEKLFTLNKMIGNYSNLYKEIIDHNTSK